MHERIILNVEDHKKITRVLNQQWQKLMVSIEQVTRLE